MHIGQIAERIGVEVNNRCAVVLSSLADAPRPFRWTCALWICSRTSRHETSSFSSKRPLRGRFIIFILTRAPIKRSPPRPFRCFAFAKQSYNRKECLEIARFALDKFLPFTGDSLYESADQRWDAMLALWQKRELPVAPPPPKKRSRRAEPVGGRAGGGGGGAAPAPAAVAVAGSAHEEEEDDEDCDDLDMGDSDYESADDENDETVADKHDGWQKLLWEMCLSFGHEMVRDLATRIITYESVCSKFLEDAAESGELTPEQLRQLVDTGCEADDILVGDKLLPNEAWELATNKVFAQTFVALAKLKCGARDGRKAAERDAMTQRFMFKAKDKVGNAVPHTPSPVTDSLPLQPAGP